MSGIVTGQRPKTVTKTATVEGQDDERLAG